MRRSVIFAFALLFALPLPLLAQHDHSMMAPTATAAPATRANAMSEGVAKKIDRRRVKSRLRTVRLPILGWGR